MSGSRHGYPALEARGPAPVDQAWRRYAEIPLWSTWAPQISGCRPAAINWPSRGGTVYVSACCPSRSRVTDARAEARTWSWLVRIGPVELNLRHAVEADGAGSRTTLDIEGPAVVVIAYAPVARFALGRLVN